MTQQKFDREKVIKGLECCHDMVDCRHCPYPCYCGYADAWPNQLMTDALALLKEQEAVEPKKQIEETEWIVCGHCNGHIIHKWKFCPSCGRSVKWE